ncbi:MAG: sulfotransferase family 2 domain-containing protein [Gemmatimonadetes bacterium]|jgi:hypothetical protein|nr:sulfotransferase family 2 domain-containing protein [Gemmatimonadota bacterium]MBT6149589.1 sulfotransferase family 2 domain-containing protein [Gemmatimonadota bacterium]MBT7862177.1 sulfotransferase family 2 domain-containing protein [Gemmatimonadota bacterium]
MTTPYPLAYARDLGKRFYRHSLMRRPTKDRVLHDYRCVYIHVPKTGGNSVTVALNQLPREETHPLYPQLTTKHAKAWQVREAMGEEKWDQYFSFAFVRNPWDLMVSSYNWWLQKAIKWRKFDADVAAIGEMGDFNAFMLSHYGRTMINRREGSLYDWISQDGEVIVDYVGRLETMADDWKEICQRVGADMELTHLNRTERQDYRTYYTDETRQLVAERFHRIIKLYDYEF